MVVVVSMVVVVGVVVVVVVGVVIEVVVGAAVDERRPTTGVELTVRLCQ